MDDRQPKLYVDYARILQDALQGAVRAILQQTEAQGLQGDHHYYINFLTNHPKTHISDNLKAEYPEEITIVLQNQFWDLKVDDKGFSVRLGFGARFEVIYVPFEAILGFSDPSAQFGLQLQPYADDEKDGEAQGKSAETPLKSGASPQEKSQESLQANKVADFQAHGKSAKKTAESKLKAGDSASDVRSDNVVTLDKFRSAKD